MLGRGVGVDGRRKTKSDWMLDDPNSTPCHFDLPTLKNVLDAEMSPSRKLGTFFSRPESTLTVRILSLKGEMKKKRKKK